HPIEFFVRQRGSELVWAFKKRQVAAVRTLLGLGEFEQEEIQRINEDDEVSVAGKSLQSLGLWSQPNARAIGAALDRALGKAPYRNVEKILLCGNTPVLFRSRLVKQMAVWCTARAN